MMNDFITRMATEVWVTSWKVFDPKVKSVTRAL